MAQPIQALKHIQPSEATYPAATQGQGNEGMLHTSARPGANLTDGGAISKPQVNSQPSTNMVYDGQAVGKNVESQLAGKQSEGIQQTRLASNNVSGKEFDAQQFLARRNAEMIYANDAGTATFQLGMPGVAETAARHAAEARFMAEGINPRQYTSGKLPT